MWNWLCKLTSRRSQEGLLPADLGTIQQVCQTLINEIQELHTQVNRIERKVYRDKDKTNGAEAERAFEPAQPAAVFDWTRLNAGDEIPPGIDI